MNSFETAMKYLLPIEGGYSNNPVDSGGPTNFGITLATLSSYEGKPVTAEDVKNLTVLKATAIYKKFYWDEMKLDLISAPKIQLCLFDQGVNRGTKTAIIMAQLAVNEEPNATNKLTVDGEIGPKTSAAINSFDDEGFCREFIQRAQLGYIDIVTRKASQIEFLKGWIRRTHALEDLVIANIYTVDATSVPKPDETSTPSKDLTPYQWAQKELGQTEIAGVKNNPRIVWYHQHTTYKGTTDEVPWCASFVCTALEETGHKSTHSAAAKSYETYGELGTGAQGDIVVFNTNGQGHVAFIDSKTYKKGDATIQVLGGNQSNKVCVTTMNPKYITAIRKVV